MIPICPRYLRARPGDLYWQPGFPFGGLLTLARLRLSPDRPVRWSLVPERFRGIAPSAPVPSARAACRSLPPNRSDITECGTDSSLLQDESLDVPRRRGRGASDTAREGRPAWLMC